jgi:crotonobetainyl-CoA:carnitine CoA-transferase CaiB-like acyl-CoA transferase
MTRVRIEAGSVAVMPAGALDGLLVADFSRVLAGPLCTMVLGDLGADVVKVERPGDGDDTRSWGASYYPALNRNKRSVALALDEPADQALARELALRADVVVESFRPGLMNGWGLGLADLRAANPRLVTCSVTAFGPDAQLPGYDLLAQASAGWMSVTGEPDGPPLKVGAPLADVLCGLHAAIGVLGALHAGTGQHVEVSLMQSGLAGLVNQASAFLNEGTVPGRLGNRHPSITPYETFPAADGELVIACGNDAIFRSFAGVIGRSELAADPRFARNDARAANREALEAELLPALRGRTVAEWVDRLRAARVPAGPVNDLEEAFAFAESLGLAPVDETAGVRTVRPPYGLSSTPARVRLPPPALDEHGDEIRGWLRQPSPGGSSSGA